MKWLLSLLGGGVVSQFTAPLLEAYRIRQAASNDADRLAADVELSRLEGMRNIAMAEAGRAWSATSVGRWLIVVPFGIWWTAIYLVQIINPWFGLDLVVVDVPPRIHDMALILVPAIIIADASALMIRRRG